MAKKGMSPSQKYHAHKITRAQYEAAVGRKSPKAPKTSRAKTTVPRTTRRKRTMTVAEVQQDYKRLVKAERKMNKDTKKILGKRMR
jgi:ribosome-binding protein aMBF1 (putative translation factor)